MGHLLHPLVLAQQLHLEVHFVRRLVIFYPQVVLPLLLDPHLFVLSLGSHCVELRLFHLFLGAARLRVLLPQEVLLDLDLVEQSVVLLFGLLQAFFLHLDFVIEIQFIFSFLLLKFHQFFMVLGQKGCSYVGYVSTYVQLFLVHFLPPPLLVVGLHVLVLPFFGLLFQLGQLHVPIFNGIFYLGVYHVDIF